MERKTGCKSDFQVRAEWRQEVWVGVHENSVVYQTAILGQIEETPCKKMVALSK